MDITSTRSKTANPERAHTLGWLWRLGIISEDAYHELSSIVSKQIMPSNTVEVIRLIDEAVTKVEKDLGGKINAEPWLNVIGGLELRIKELEDKLESLNSKLTPEEYLKRVQEQIESRFEALNKGVSKKPVAHKTK